MQESQAQPFYLKMKVVGVSQFPVVAKNTSETKSSLGRFKSSLDTAEEKICAWKEVQRENPGEQNTEAS